MHAIVPPHPGPVTAATEIGASIGLTVLIGVPVSVIAWYVGVYLFTTIYAGKIYVPIDDSVLTGRRNGSADADDKDSEDGEAYGRGTCRRSGT